MPITIKPDAPPPVDSRPDTWAHIHKVRGYLSRVIRDLLARANAHDQSKLVGPERDIFDRYTPMLAQTTYGTDEYRGHLAAMRPALEHHYRENSHHPEHYANGIAGMDLLDLIEMVCDWKAASERHVDGNLLDSIEVNAGRFGYDDTVKGILHNTAARLGFYDLEPAYRVTQATTNTRAGQDGRRTCTQTD